MVRAICRFTRTTTIAALLALIVLAVSAGSAFAAVADKTYYMFVFSNPVVGQEDEYNRWYDGEHVKDVVAVPGFVEARRFKLADQQMISRPDIPALPRYLVAYRIQAPDLAAVMAEVGARVRSGRTKISPAYDKASSATYTYAILGADEGARLLAAAGAPHSPARQAYLHIVFTVAAEGQQQAFDSWYDAQHMPDMLRTPGMVAGQRLVLANAGRASVPATQYAAIFRADTTDDAALAAAFKATAPTMRRSTTLDRVLTRGYTYRAIGLPVSGDAVRAERKSRP